MNRRDAILALAALGLVPLPGRGQTAGMRKIGILGLSNPEPGLGYLREALRELGYVEGKNIQIEIRSASDKPGALPATAAELVALKPEVIVAFLTPAIRATSTIPIVMASCCGKEPRHCSSGSLGTRQGRLRHGIRQVGRRPGRRRHRPAEPAARSCDPTRAEAQAHHRLSLIHI